MHMRKPLLLGPLLAALVLAGCSQGQSQPLNVNLNVKSEDIEQSEYEAMLGEEREILAQLEADQKRALDKQRKKDAQKRREAQAWVEQKRLAKLRRDKREGITVNYLNKSSYRTTSYQIK